MTESNAETTLCQLSAEATPGPWVPQSPTDGREPDWYIDTHMYEDGPSPVVTQNYPLAPADAALIAYTRNRADALADVVAAARMVVDLWPNEHPALDIALAALDGIE